MDKGSLSPALDYDGNSCEAPYFIYCRAILHCAKKVGAMLVKLIDGCIASARLNGSQHKFSVAPPMLCARSVRHALPND